MDQKPRIARRITIIKGSFQTPYVFLTAGFFGALTLLIFLDFSYFMQDSILANPARPDLAEIFSKATWTFYLRFALYLLSLIFFLYVLLHRLAGPVLRFQRLAKSVREGDLTHRVRLRNYDGLKYLQDDINGMMEFLTCALKADRQNVENALKELERLENQPLSPDLRTSLESVKSSLSFVLKTLKL